MPFFTFLHKILFCSTVFYDIHGISCNFDLSLRFRPILPVKMGGLR